MTEKKVINGYKAWWLLFTAGFALICLGISSILEPWITFIRIVKYSGFAVMAGSILIFIRGSIVSSTLKERIWLICESVLDLFLATVLLFNPFLVVTALPLLIGAWMLIRGLLKIFASLSLSHVLKGWRYVMAIGVIFTCSGLLIIFYPFPKLNAMRLCMSFLAILIGAVYLYDSLRLKSKEDTLILII